MCVDFSRGTAATLTVLHTAPICRPSADAPPGPKTSSAAKRKLRNKKRKEEERKRAKGEGEMPEPKIYRAWFLLRDLFFENNKTLHHRDVLQVCVHRSIHIQIYRWLCPRSAVGSLKVVDTVEIPVESSPPYIVTCRCFFSSGRRDISIEHTI